MTNTVAPLTSIPLAVPAENCKAEAPPIYRLRKRFAAVHFQKSGKGRIVFLPEGADLRLVGPSPLSKCLEVVCDHRRYHIFQADLLGPWATPVRNSRRGMVRAKAFGTCA